MDTIGERIRFLRTREGLSMEQLADKIEIPLVKTDGKVVATTKNVTSGTISNAENNKHSPSVDLVIAIAKYFNVTLDWLLLGEGTIQKGVVNNLELMIEYDQKRKVNDEKKMYMELAKKFLIENSDKIIEEVSNNLYETRNNTKDSE